MSASRAMRSLSPFPRRFLWIAGAGIVLLVASALLSGGLLGLPRAPRGVTAEQAGLADLQALRERGAALDAATAGATAPAEPTLAAAVAGLALIRRDDPEQGLARLREAFERAPHDLVLGNAYRMAAMSLKRRFIADVSRGGTETERLPDWLAHEPLATLERMDRGHAAREVTLQHALAWADEIVLFPALEIQAPANVESVKLLTALLEREPSYVPALYGRGLNYLHRPARLVWPENRKTAPDAASRDFGLAVAIGARVGGASPRLRGTMALALGDSYAKEGRVERARSWWQIAENAGHDSSLDAAVRRRFTWENPALPDRLEAELEGRLLSPDPPLTDLAVMWR